MNSYVFIVIGAKGSSIMLSSTEFNEAQESFAAWKTDFKSHMESASGGLASAFL